MNDTRSAENADSPLNEFRTFFLDFNSVYAQVAKFAMAAPLLDLILNIGPTWPSRLAVGFLVVIVQVLIVMCSFAVWRQGRTSLRIVKRWLVIATCLFVSFLIVGYLPLFAYFVHPNPTYSEAAIGGMDYTQPAKILADSPEGYSAKQLLEEFDRDPTRVWEKFGLFVGRVSVLATWLIASVCYGIGVSAFVAIQYRRFQ